MTKKKTRKVKPLDNVSGKERDVAKKKKVNNNILGMGGLPFLSKATTLIARSSTDNQRCCCCDVIQFIDPITDACLFTRFVHGKKTSTRIMDDQTGGGSGGALLVRCDIPPGIDIRDTRGHIDYSIAHIYLNGCGCGEVHTYRPNRHGQPCEKYITGKKNAPIYPYMWIEGGAEKFLVYKYDYKCNIKKCEPYLVGENKTIGSTCFSCLIDEFDMNFKRPDVDGTSSTLLVVKIDGKNDSI